MQQLSLLEVSTTPTGVDIAVWNLFVKAADNIRAAGFRRYGARAIMEYIRFNEVVNKGNREFKVNNNQQTALSEGYMKLRNCPGFFERRKPHYMNSEAA